MSLHLYQIPGEFRRLMDEIEDTPFGEPISHLHDQLDALEGTLEEKVRWRVALIREREAEADAIKQEVTRLRQLATAKENAATRLKSEIMVAFMEMDIQKLDVGIAKVGVQKASRPAIAWTRGMDELPTPFLRTKLELDGNAAYEFFKEKGSLPDGFEVRHSTFLSIR